MTVHDPEQCLTCKAKAEPEDKKENEVAALLARFAELRERFGPTVQPRKDLA